MPRHTAFRAIGVEFIQQGIVKRAYIKTAILPDSLQAQIDSNPRGILLSAGAINDPKLLMNSGIGPQDELQRAGVEVSVPAEGVGRNLQDHPSVGLIVELDPLLAYGGAAEGGTDLLARLPAYVRAVVNARNTPGFDPRKRHSRSDPGWSRRGGGGRAVHEHETNATSTFTSEKDPNFFGPLGAPGVAVGAFLVSPFADQGSKGGKGDKPEESPSPDLQITVHPTVIEPFGRLASFDKSKQGKDRGNVDPNFADSDPSTQEYASVDSQGNTNTVGEAQLLMPKPRMLVTVSLLRPEITQRVRLNRLDPSLGSPILTPDDNSDSSLSFQQGQGQHRGRGGADIDDKDIDRSGGGDSANANRSFSERSGAGRLTQRDQQRLRWGLERVRQILQTQPLKVHIGKEVAPGSHVESAAQLEHWVTEHAVPSNQWAGSCRMGPKSDPMAVLDEQFRVYSVADLRVVDAAAMPSITSGDLHATVMAMAVYAAESILENLGTDDERMVDLKDLKDVQLEQAQNLTLLRKL